MRPLLLLLLLSSATGDDTGSLLDATLLTKEAISLELAETIGADFETYQAAGGSACEAYDSSGRKRAFTVREADAFVLLRRGGLDEVDLVPSSQMTADAKGEFVALDDAAPLEVVLELECDVANSNCVISKIKR